MNNSATTSSKIFSGVYALLSLFCAFIMVVLITSNQAFADFRGSVLFTVALITFVATSAATWVTFQYNYETPYKPSKFTLILKALFGAYAVAIILFIVFNILGLFILGFKITDSITSQYGNIAILITTLIMFPFIKRFMK